jgi:hypothetical protein
MVAVAVVLVAPLLVLFADHPLEAMVQYALFGLATVKEMYLAPFPALIQETYRYLMIN